MEKGLKTKSKVNKKFKVEEIVSTMTEEYTLHETVFRTFLKDPSMGPSKMAGYLEANYNSVKAVFSKLYDEGLLDREGRGKYTPNVPQILLYLMDRIENLERGGG